MAKIIILSISLLLIIGCIDPVKFQFDRKISHTVIEASFSNKSGVKYVRVTKSSEFSSPYNIFVNNAKVYITSLEGENYSFVNTKMGYYFSDSTAKAIEGHTYTLHIAYDGLNYESEPIKMATRSQLATINKVNIKYAERYAIVKGKKEKQLVPGYDILVDYTDVSNEKNFYRWSYKRTYEVKTQPENYIDYGCPQRNCPRPAPKACCKECWVTEVNDMVQTATDFLRDGSKVSNQLVLFIPFYQYLNKKMELIIYQHSITEKAHNYLKAIGNQTESTGSMFDVPPTELKGNIFNIADKAEKVIGFFEASVASSSAITIADVNNMYTIPEFEYPDDCLVMPGATNKRPPNW